MSEGLRLSHPAGSQFVTGEAVALDVGVAALPSRAVARFVDLVAQGTLLVVLALLAAVSGASSSEAANATLGLLAFVLALLAYPIAFETLLRGRTPGKMAMGLRVVRDDGGPVGFRQCFVRGLSTVVDLLTLFVPSVACMLLGAQSKRIGDLLAGTVVAQERVSTRGGQVAMMPRGLAGWAGTLELSRLSDDLALSVRQFVARAPELTPAAREDLGGRLVQAVREVTAPPPPPDVPGWAFLAAVLAERRRREEQRLAPSPAAPSYGAPPYGAAVVSTQPPDGKDPSAGTPPDRPGGFVLPS